MNDIDLTAQPAEDRKGRNRRFLVWGAVAAVGALITAAAFVDSEWADINPEGGYQTGAYNLQLSENGHHWTDHSSAENALPVKLSGGKLTPGDEGKVTGTYHVRNASEDYASTLTLTMDEKVGATTDEELRNALIFDIKVGGEQVLDGSASYNDLATGVDLANLATEQKRDVIVTVSVDKDLSAQDQQANLQLKFDGTAVS